VGWPLGGVQGHRLHQAHAGFRAGARHHARKENICHYAQRLSFDVDEKGKITGEGEALYVFYGKADNKATMFMPLLLPPGGFFATFQGGYRIRKFQVEGVVTPDGTVYIGGRPEKPMYLLNVYMLQKIYGWNVFPPPADDPGKPGLLQTGKRGEFWTMEAERYNTVSGMNYETLIFKTDEKFNMAKGCKIFCSQEPLDVKTSGDKLGELKCEFGAGPVKIEGNNEELEAEIDTGLFKVKAGAKYGKPGDLGRLIREERTSGCEDAPEGEAGTMKLEATRASLGFTNERNPITGDETFQIGIIEFPSNFGVGPVKGEIKQSLTLVVNSRCGVGARYSVKTKVGAEAEAEFGGMEELGVDGMKACANCGKEKETSVTVWAGNNL